MLTFPVLVLIYIQYITLYQLQVKLFLGSLADILKRLVPVLHAFLFVEVRHRVAQTADRVIDVHFKLIRRNTPCTVTHDDHLLRHIGGRNAHAVLFADLIRRALNIRVRGLRLLREDDGDIVARSPLTRTPALQEIFCNVDFPDKHLNIERYLQKQHQKKKTQIKNKIFTLTEKLFRKKYVHTQLF